MKLKTLAITLILASTSYVWSQDAKPPVPPAEGRQPPRLRRGMDRLDPAVMKDEMAKTLGLDEAQKSQAEQILTSHQKKLSDLRTEMRPSEELMAKQMKIREELRTARDNKDDAKVRELMEQITALRKEDEEKKLPLRKAHEEARQSLKTDLLAIMREDQKLRFETFWTEKMEPKQNRFRGRARTPQALKAMVDRMAGISGDQKTQIEGLFKQHFEASRTPAADPAANEALVKKLYDDVLNLLTPEQRQEIEKKLEGNSRPREPGKPQADVSVPPSAPGG